MRKGEEKVGKGGKGWERVGKGEKGPIWVRLEDTLLPLVVD